MAGSLLRTVGLPELVAYDMVEYETLGLRLAGDAPLLAGYRARLAARRGASPLFDTARFCRDLELAFIAMWERHGRGEAPSGFKAGGAAC